MKVVLDTNIYISHYRWGLHKTLLERLNAEYILHLHAVVLTELLAGAHTPAFKRELKRLQKVFESRDRIIHPQKRDYLLSGDLIRKMKGQVQFADSLLATSSRHEGCLLVTEDQDFLRIRKHIPLSVSIISKTHS